MTDVNDIHTAKALANIKLRIFEMGIRQEQVAEEAGYDPTLFSRFLRGRRPPPADFFEKVNAVLDRLERAEKAAQAAKEKVLNEGVA